MERIERTHLWKSKLLTTPSPVMTAPISYCGASIFYDIKELLPIRDGELEFFLFGVSTKSRNLKFSSFCSLERFLESLFFAFFINFYSFITIDELTMSSSRLTSQLQAFREKALVDQMSLNLINQESPLERMRREIQEELEQSEKYRASILQNVTTFGKLYSFTFLDYSIISMFLAGLSIEAIHTAARSMEEVFYKKGDIIIYQDDIGDSFYVLEEGLVSVTVSGAFTSDI